MAKHGKERIIAAAFELFLKHGFKGVSLKDIIQSTGLSKGAIYHHFSSKREIYVAAVDEYYLKILQNIDLDDENENFKDRIRSRFQFACQLFDYVEQTGNDGIQYPIRSFFIFQLESERDEELRAVIKKNLVNYRNKVQAIIQSAIAKGEISVQLTSQVIAEQILSMIEGIAIHHSTLEKDSMAFLQKKYNQLIGSYLDLISNKI